MKKPEKTTAKDWLKMDLKAQSGSIWTDEKSKLQKKNKYKISESAMVLKPDPIKYGGKEIPEYSHIIE